MPVSDQEIAEARRHLLAWLTVHMETEGLTKEQFAERLGLTKGVITQWFSGTGRTGLPGFASLLAIKREIGVDLDVILRKLPYQRKQSPEEKSR
jgi:transcriptional regulator with XRE-family HTH domain